MTRRLAVLTCLGLLVTAAPTATQSAADPVAALISRLADGRVRLAKDGESGYLRSLLAALDVPVSSQSLTFVSSAL